MSKPNMTNPADVTAISDGPPEPASSEVEAYRHILRRIRLGELQPGARMRTEDIAVTIGMSRQPVREAIRRLEAEGYVTSRPNRGAMVRQYTPEQLLELFEIRAALEGLAAQIAAPQLQPDDFTRLEAQLALMDDASASCGEATNDWLARHVEFHLHLVRLARRPRLAIEIARLHAMLEPYLRLWFVNAGTPTNSRDEHDQILQILRYGYPKHAEDVMRAHVLSTAAHIIPHVKFIGQTATLDEPG
jgi:DNA-binding GntR family transcriptional regulator